MNQNKLVYFLAAGLISASLSSVAADNTNQDNNKKLAKKHKSQSKN